MVSVKHSHREVREVGFDALLPVKFALMNSGGEAPF
jgi:hypothetical protein